MVKLSPLPPKHLIMLICIDLTKTHSHVCFVFLLPLIMIVLQEGVRACRARGIREMLGLATLMAKDLKNMVGKFFCTYVWRRLCTCAVLISQSEYHY